MELSCLFNLSCEAKERRVNKNLRVLWIGRFLWKSSKTDLTIFAKSMSLIHSDDHICTSLFKNYLKYYMRKRDQAELLSDVSAGLYYGMQQAEIKELHDGGIRLHYGMLHDGEVGMYDGILHKGRQVCVMKYCMIRVKGLMITLDNEGTGLHDRWLFDARTEFYDGMA